MIINFDIDSHHVDLAIRRNLLMNAVNSTCQNGNPNYVLGLIVIGLLAKANSGATLDSLLR
jgi:hypothetical protein